MTTFAKTPRPERKCSLHNRGQYTGSFAKCPWCSEPRAQCTEPKPLEDDGLAALVTTALGALEEIERVTGVNLSLVVTEGRDPDQWTHAEFLAQVREARDELRADADREAAVPFRGITTPDGHRLTIGVDPGLSDSEAVLVAVRTPPRHGKAATFHGYTITRMTSGGVDVPVDMSNEAIAERRGLELCACGKPAASWERSSDRAGLVTEYVECLACFRARVNGPPAPHIDLNDEELQQRALAMLAEKERARSTPRYADGSECKVGDAVRHVEPTRAIGELGDGGHSIVVKVNSETARVAPGSASDVYAVSRLTPIRDPDELAKTIRENDTIAFADGRRYIMRGRRPDDMYTFESAGMDEDFWCGPHIVAGWLRLGATIVRREQEGETA